MGLGLCTTKCLFSRQIGFLINGQNVCASSVKENLKMSPNFSES